MYEHWKAETVFRILTLGHDFILNMTGVYLENKSEKKLLNENECGPIIKDEGRKNLEKLSGNVEF